MRHASSSIEVLGSSWQDVTCFIEKLIVSIMAEHRPLDGISATALHSEGEFRHGSLCMDLRTARSASIWCLNGENCGS